MPMTVWAMFITAILQAFALPVLTSALIMQLPPEWSGPQPANWSVANAPPVTGGGNVILWSAPAPAPTRPAAMAMILPAMGMVSDISLPRSRGSPLGYKPMVPRDRRIKPGWASPGPPHALCRA
ncbi:MAG: hypothetical protein U0794_19660 [Isosphaeraceae bacterium]